MLNAVPLPEDVELCSLKSRGCMLATIVSEFRAAFPGIAFEVDTQTRIVNAQAFGQGGVRFVRLYGGFAFHPLVSEDALVFAILHETGHHRARGRRFAGDPGLACDCLADKWAVGPGARMLRRHSGRVLNLANALESLDAMIASIDVGSGHLSGSQKKRHLRPHDCWTGYWSTRKSRLSSGIAPAPTGPCYYYS